MHKASADDAPIPSRTKFNTQTVNSVIRLDPVFGLYAEESG